MRLRNYVIILAMALIAIGVSVLTVKPVAETRRAPVSSQKQSKSTQSSSSKKASEASSTLKKSTVKKVNTETVGEYTLTQAPTAIPTALVSGQAPAGWSTPISLSIAARTLAGTSEQNMVRFDGLSVGSTYRVWVKPVTTSGSQQGYKIDYRPTSSSSYVPTRLLRTALTQAQNAGEAVTQLTLYNVRRSD